MTVSVTSRRRRSRRRARSTASGSKKNKTVSIPLVPSPTGEATIDVEVKAVPGEQVTDNNEASYTVQIDRRAKALRVAYLGPAGTFTRMRCARREPAARTSSRSPRPRSTRRSRGRAGEADRALVPFENSIEGAVRSTLDTLAFDADGVTIVGEHDLPSAC